MIIKSELIDLAKEVDKEYQIDWGSLSIDEDQVYDLIASQVMEIYNGTQDESKEKVLMASLIQVLVENFKLNLIQNGFCE